MRIVRLVATKLVNDYYIVKSIVIAELLNKGNSSGCQNIDIPLNFILNILPHCIPGVSPLVGKEAFRSYLNTQLELVRFFRPNRVRNDSKNYTSSY